MSEFTLSLKINTVGDKEALRALDDLDRKGRKIVEDAAGALGKSMGAVAVAYQRGSKAMKMAIEDVADAHRKAAQEADRQGSAADALAKRQGMATLQATRGMEQLARSASGTGSAMATILSQVSQISFSFGPAGPLVGAIAVAGLAIVEIFEKAKAEMKKAVDEAEKEFKRLAKAGDREAIRSRIKELVGGDRFGETDEDVAGIEGARARRKQLEAQRAALLKANPELSASTGVIAGGVARMIGNEAAATIARASDEIRDLDRFLSKVTPEVIQLRGRLRELDREQGVKDAAKRSLGLGKDRDAQAQRDVEAFNRTQKMAAAEYRRVSEQAAGDLEDQLDDDLKFAMQQFNEQQKAAQAAYKVAGSEAVREMTGSGGPIQVLAQQMNAAISSAFGDGIVAGFESAFSGKGIGNAFKTLTATVLAGLGGFMEQLGMQMIVIGLALDALASSLLSLNGPAAIAAGVALVAAGAGLKAIASSFGGNSASGAGSSAGGGASAAPSFLSFGVQASATPTTSQQAPSAKTTNNFTIIGPADPKAQRAIADIVNAGTDRNLIRRTA